MLVWKFYKLSFFFWFTICVAVEGESPNVLKIKVAKEDKGKLLEPSHSIGTGIHRTLDFLKNNEERKRSLDNSYEYTYHSSEISSDETELSGQSNELVMDSESDREKVESNDIYQTETGNRRKFVRKILRTDPNLGLAIPYYKIFLNEILNVVVEKDDTTLVKLAVAFGEEIGKLIENNDLLRFGEPFGEFIEKFGKISKNVSAKILKGAAEIGLKLWKDQQKQNDSDIYDLVHLLNNFITYKEGHEILLVIDRVTNYPENEKTAKEIIQHMIHSILLDPIKRDDGTSNLIIGKLNKCIQSFLDKLKNFKKITNPRPTNPPVASTKRMMVQDKTKKSVVTRRENELIKKKSLRKHATYEKHSNRRKTKHHKKSRKHKHKKSKSVFSTGKRYLHRYKKYLNGFKHKRKHKKRKKHKSKRTKKRKHRKKRGKKHVRKIETSSADSEETSQEPGKSSNRLTIEYDSFEEIKKNNANKKPQIQVTAKHELKQTQNQKLTSNGPTTSTDIQPKKVRLRKRLIDYFTGQYVSVSPRTYKVQKIRMTTTDSSEHMSDTVTDVSYSDGEVVWNSNLMEAKDHTNYESEKRENAGNYPRAQTSGRFKKIIEDYGAL